METEITLLNIEQNSFLFSNYQNEWIKHEFNAAVFIFAFTLLILLFITYFWVSSTGLVVFYYYYYDCTNEKQQQKC
jgi:signal transduction histidine kinase